MSTTKAVLQAFDDYQRARLAFAQWLASLSSRAALVETMRCSHAMPLLLPLLNDPLPKIDQFAALAVGRIVNTSSAAAADAVDTGFIKQTLFDFENRTHHYKKHAMLIMKGIARHCASMANQVVGCGGLAAAILCLEDGDAGVREAGAWVVAHVAKHDEKLANQVLATGAVEPLRLLVLEQELCLKYVAVSALTELVKHSAWHTSQFLDLGCLPVLVKYLQHNDPKLKRLILCCLAHVAGHTVDLAESTVEAGAFPASLHLLAHLDVSVRRAAATLVREVVKHNRELAGLVVNGGGVEVLVQALRGETDIAFVPVLMALGFVAAHSDLFASAIISAQAVPILTDMLRSETDQGTLAMAVWVLGHIGKYSSEHSKVLAENETFCELVKLYLKCDTSEDVKQKIRSTCKLVFQKCTHTPALDALFHAKTPPELFKYVLGQYAKLLANDAGARRKFVINGFLATVQCMNPSPGSAMFEYINHILQCFPEDIIRYYSPEFPEMLLDKVEEFSPQVPPLFQYTNLLDDEEETADNIMSYKITCPPAAS